MKINSKEENEFVLNLVNKLAPSLKQIWIGLEWDSSLKAFVWYDHSVPTYTKWSPNEPNGNGVEPCSNMWTGHEGSLLGHLATGMISLVGILVYPVVLSARGCPKYM